MLSHFVHHCQVLEMKVRHGLGKRESTQEIYPSPRWIVVDNKTFPSNEMVTILHIFAKNFHKQGTQKWSLPVRTVWYLNLTIPPRISPFTNTSLLILHQHPIPLISPQLFNSFILTSDSVPSLSNYGITGPLLELLQFRADPNIFGPFGASPLGFATSAKTVQLLLRFRAQAGLTGRNSPKRHTSKTTRHFFDDVFDVFKVFVNMFSNLCSTATGLLYDWDLGMKKETDSRKKLSEGEFQKLCPVQTVQTIRGTKIGSGELCQKARKARPEFFQVHDSIMM